MTSYKRQKSQNIDLFSKVLSTASRYPTECRLTNGAIHVQYV